MIEKEDYYQADYCPYAKCPFRVVTCANCCESGQIEDYERFRFISFVNSMIAFKHGREER